MTKLEKTLISVVIMVCFAFSAVLLFVSPKVTVGSTIQGNDYQSTSTAASAAYGAQTLSVVVKTGQGALGSVVVTGANTGVVNIYDATTTNINNRASSKATSTILIASLPASLAVGTYTFDAEFTDGLYVDNVSGLMPTTTITYR